MINVYLYASNTLFIDETKSGYVTTYLKHKNNPDISRLESEDLDYIINKVFPFICFGLTDTGYEALPFYFNDIVQRQNEDNLKNFTVRTCSTEVISYILAYTRNKIIDTSFFKIEIEGFKVDFDNDGYLASENPLVQKHVNWRNYYNLERGK